MTSIRLVTFTTSGSARLAANWLSSVHRLRLDAQAEVYCGDRWAYGDLTAYARLIGSTAAIRRFECSASLKAVLYGTPEFASQIARSKLELQEWLNGAVFRPYLFCDADTVLLNDPTSSLEGRNDAAIFLQSDRADWAMPTTQSNLVNPGVHCCARPVPEL